MTGYADPTCWIVAQCSKCEGTKRWNTWYHSDPTLCDDCYFIGGKYYDLTKKEAMKLERKRH